MRLFIGIGVPDAVADRLSVAARNHDMPKGTRWTTPGNMHVTLSFLGNVDPGLLEQIQQKLAAIRAGSFHVEMAGLDVFAHAGILMASVKPSAALLSLAERINAAMELCGIPRELRAYTPHITLARFKGRPAVQPSDKGNAAFFQTFAAQEFRLYESFTRPEGAQYEVLNHFPLR
jgi:RNA 2',3'-cyclic 3'-phosphodiesterase